MLTSPVRTWSRTATQIILSGRRQRRRSRDGSLTRMASLRSVPRSRNYPSRWPLAVSERLEWHHCDGAALAEHGRPVWGCCGPRPVRGRDCQSPYGDATASPVRGRDMGQIRSRKAASVSEVDDGH